MPTIDKEVIVRPMTIGDIDATFFIDHEIRKAGKAITYENLTTERIFTIDRHVGRSAKPVSYVDLIKGDISELLGFSFVAEVEGHVHGFILGGIEHVGETATKVGVIRIVGVHPEYQRKSIATSLVNAICEKYQSKGIKKIKIDIDQRDKQLLSFVEHMGFNVGHLIDYSKTI
ncbi:MAG TPA: GNAT family N-acetyltransferase [Dehalococcoidia bacterium]|nr:GNAT family N-acetyltransferase [Dehalococcoidia bacterium]